ncbi:MULTISPECIES: oxidoreductase [Cellulomonas]|uniref:oxidoreductase n=1 Tax=Cellulomonas TaxID=1707 RepID=UPI0010A7A99A|nr:MULTISPECIES: oxidoreductase [Cellulomonas]
MTTFNDLLAQQRPLRSGFGATSTANDVLSDTDLSGMTAVVTGGHSGLGLATTRALTTAGARVIVPARRPNAAREALHGTEGVEVAEMDLADGASIRSFADQLADRRITVDLVVAGAGVMACPEQRVGAGWELQFATNHLGHFAMVNRLVPVLNPVGARVVVVSSGAHRITGIRWDDIHFEHHAYDRWQAYGQSKTANALFATQLSVLGRDRGILAYSVHPGLIITPLQRHIPRAEQIELGWIDELGRPGPEFKTPAQGAATIVWAATSPLLADRTGVYCEDCDIAPVAAPDGAGPGVAPWAIDPSEAERLWEYSARITELGPGALR